MCYYAQSHIDDSDTWSITPENRENLLQCTSFQIACFLSNNTVDGEDGVEWDIVIKELVEHPMKSETEWENILNRKANELGGWKIVNESVNHNLEKVEKNA